MKPLLLGTIVLGLVLAPAAAEAKGCIKGAIVGGIAGHMAGHGKVGVVAGCIIGHHEASKRDAEKAESEDAAFFARRTNTSSLEPAARAKAAAQAALPAPGEAAAISSAARNWLSNACAGTGRPKK